MMTQHNVIAGWTGPTDVEPSDLLDRLPGFHPAVIVRDSGVEEVIVTLDADSAVQAVLKTSLALNRAGMRQPDMIEALTTDRYDLLDTIAREQDRRSRRSPRARLDDGEFYDPAAH